MGTLLVRTRNDAHLGRVPLTSAEEASRDAEEAVADAAIAEEKARKTATQYRRDRAAAYISDLSEEGDFQNTAGEVLDALIKWTQGDKAELERMVVKTDQIKKRFPKPQA